MTQKLSLFFLIAIFAFVTVDSKAEEENTTELYYQSILEAVIEADGNYEPEEYKLIDLDKNKKVSFSNHEEVKESDAVQVVTDMNGEVYVDTFFAYTYDQEGKFVNAFEMYGEMIPSEDQWNFNGSIVKCRAKYHYRTISGNYYFFPQELGITWLSGNTVHTIDAHFYARGPLFYDDDFDNPVTEGFFFQLNVVKSDPTLGTEYTDGTDPLRRYIGMWNPLTDGGYVSLIVNGLEQQYPVADKWGFS